MSQVSGAGIGPADAPVTDATSAYQQMEAAFLRQLLSSSGAFKPSDVAGGQLRTDMFIEALADAVSKGGGIGIARMLEDSMSNNQGLDEAEAPDVDDSAGAGAGAGKTRAPRAPMLVQSRPGFASAPAPMPMPATETATANLPPAPARQVTSPFGSRVDPIDGARKFHPGIDLRAAAGEPIRVAGEGVVRRAGPRGGYGNAVEIDHGGGLTTLYAHASEVSVNPGERVVAGQEIARVGQTGRATGPHLHFEVRLNNRQVDPTRYAGVVNRALNTYQKRAEDINAGKLGAPGGETP
jgi:murein DD-endopeptidase MepM/ murein hydrolase activator NlpD